MSLWRHLTHGVRVLTRRSRADRALGDEVDHYLQEATAAYMDQGLSPEDAGRAARMEVGNALRVREEVREIGWEHALETLSADTRYAWRRLIATPSFTVVTVLTLALGMAATTAIFSVVYPILFETLPYPKADRVLAVWDHSNDGSQVDVTFGTHRELTERTHSFEAFAVMRAWQPTMTAAAEPDRLEGQRVTSRYFHAFGVLPAIGRTFDAKDDVVNGPRVVILGDRLWRRRFNSDPTIVGRTITLDENAHTVIGVMPRSFENVLAPLAELWAPLQYDVSLPINGREWGHHLRMVARLAPGVLPEAAQQELDHVAKNPIPQLARAPWASLRNGLTVHRLQDDVTKGVKPALMAIVGAVVLVLTIVCVNVTNLLLARSSQRRGEFAMRIALGAPRRRLIQQVITESLLLAVLGGALGVALATVGIRALTTIAPVTLPRASAIAIDTTVFAFAFGLTTLVGLIVGVVPAFIATSRKTDTALRQSATRITGSHQWTRRTLVVVEVALALVLLVGAGLLLRSVRGLFAIEPGFQTDHAITMQVQVSGRRFRDLATTHQFYARALDEVRQIPGVRTAALTSQLPLSGEGTQYGAEFERDDPTTRDQQIAPYRYAVSPGYFEALGIPLIRGRYLDVHDTADAAGAVVMSESFARQRFPVLDPIGQRVRIGGNDSPWATIVGVVGDVKQSSLTVSGDSAVYTTTTQWRFADIPLWLVVYAHGDPEALLPAIRSAIWSVDKDQPIVRVTTLERLVAASEAERRFALVMFQLFGVVALALAAIGIYGVLAGGVSERIREIGIRAALGAPRVAILALIVRQGLTLTGIGAALGVVGAVAASGALATMLYGVTNSDPVTYAGVIGLLTLVSASACALPAYRAARVDPATTLRTE